MKRRDLIDVFKTLDNDVDRWKWIIENKKYIEIYLDYDETVGTFKKDEISGWFFSFKKFLGVHEGIRHLLAALEIDVK